MESFVSLRWKVIGAAVAIVSALTLLTFAPAASADAEGPFLILPWSGTATSPSQKNMCVEVKGGSTASSARIQQYPCYDGQNTNMHQKWYLEDTTGGWQHIVNAKSGMCMNVQGGSAANGAAVIQYRCQGFSSFNDQWKVDYYIDNGNLTWWRIRNRQSERCLNVQGGSDAAGVKMIQYTCSDSYNNIFIIVPPT